MSVKMTNAELSAFIARGHKVTSSKTVGECLAEVAKKMDVPAKPVKPKRKKRDDGYDSQGEADFADVLESLRIKGRIKRWVPHPGRLRLSDKDPQTGRDRNYNPDFLVEWHGGYVEWIEVKGRMKWEDAMKSFDWARSAYPMFAFRMVERMDDGEWKTIRGDTWNEIS